MFLKKGKKKKGHWSFRNSCSRAHSTALSTSGLMMLGVWGGSPSERLYTPVSTKIEGHPTPFAPAISLEQLKSNVLPEKSTAHLTPDCLFHHQGKVFSSQHYLMNHILPLTANHVPKQKVSDWPQCDQLNELTLLVVPTYLSLFPLLLISESLPGGFAKVVLQIYTLLLSASRIVYTGTRVHFVPYTRLATQSWTHPVQILEQGSQIPITDRGYRKLIPLGVHFPASQV